MYDNNYNRGWNDINIDAMQNKEYKMTAMKKQFSRCFLGLFIYSIISTAVITAVQIAAILISGNETAIRLFSNGGFIMLINAVAQYAIAFPIFFLIVMGIRKSSATKRKQKLSASDFILLLLICYAAMYIGSIIGEAVNNFISGIIGYMPSNDVSSLIEETSVYTTFIFTVILAPIFEELIFRKLLIDRLSVYGDKTAIIFSAVGFGLFHGNLYQFFYAMLVGLVLSYVYTLTRDVRYTIAMHMILNFLGSVAVMPVQEAINDMNELLMLMQSGHSFDMIELIYKGGIYLLYSAFQTGMLAGGVVALIHFIRGRRIKISSDRDIYLSNGELVKCGIVNVGTIFFLVHSALTILTSLLT